MRSGVVYAAVLGLAVAAGPATAADPGADDKFRDTVLGLEKQGWEALKKQDWAALKATVADDFVAITADGKRMDRDGLTKELSAIRVSHYGISDAKVARLTPDAAVLTYKLKVEYTVAGESGPAQSEAAWVSSGWAHRDGKWVNVTYHESAVKK